MKLFRRKSLEDQSDEELFMMLRNARDEAFGELYQRYHRKLRFFFLQLLNGDEEKAQDFLHDLFVKLIEKPERFDPSRRFSTWVYTVAGNMCKNHYRDSAVRRVVGRDEDMNRFGGDHAQADDILERKFFKESLGRELEKLSPDHKMVFLLRFHEGMPLKEIAQAMECSEGTVKSRLFYTLKKLGKNLEMYHPKYREGVSHG